MNIRFIFLFFTFVSIVAKAQESQTVYNFLRLPVSAHAAALGGDNITLVEDDASLMFHNPALLSTVSDKSIALNYMSYMSGVNTASASFNRIIKERTTIALSAQYIDYGTMSERDALDTELGTFSAKDISIATYLSYLLSNKWAGGISLKWINSYIASYSSMSIGVDLGINYFDSNRLWSLSLTVKNLGGQIKSYDDEYEKMPLDVIFGVSKRITNTPFSFSLTFADLNHWDYPLLRHATIGIDAKLSSIIWAAAGYNLRRANEMKITSSSDNGSSNHGAGVSIGAGVNLERFNLSLAYGKYHVSSSSLLLNLAYKL